MVTPFGRGFQSDIRSNLLDSRLREPALALNLSASSDSGIENTSSQSGRTDSGSEISVRDDLRALPDSLVDSRLPSALADLWMIGSFSLGQLKTGASDSPPVHSSLAGNESESGSSQTGVSVTPAAPYSSLGSSMLDTTTMDTGSFPTPSRPAFSGGVATVIVAPRAAAADAPPCTGTITLKMAAFIPKSLGDSYSWDTPPSGSDAHWLDVNWLPEPVNGLLGAGTNLMFATDDREAAGDPGTSRLHSDASIAVASIGNLNGTLVFATSAGASAQASRISSVGTVLYLNTLHVLTAEASSQQTVTDGLGLPYSGVSLSASASHPFSTIFGINYAPTIDYNFQLSLGRNDQDCSAAISVSGQHNNFPAYEFLVNGNVAYQYRPAPGSGPNLWNLNTSTSFSFSIYV